MIKKAPLLFFFFFCSFLVCTAQTKEIALNKYFLEIRVTDSVENNLKFIDTSSLFGIDSILKSRGVFSSYKGQQPFTNFSIEKIVILLQKQTWQDSVTKEYFDSSSIYSIEYFFGKDDKKGRDDFYNSIRKEFQRFYLFSDERRLSGKYNATSTRFTLGQFDRFAELTIYKGQRKNQFYYVTVRFDKRTHYLTENPMTTIQVF